MAKRECEREFDVMQSAATGAASEELRAHIGQCDDCRDLAEVAGAVLDDRGALMRGARLPGAGLMWWRVNMRAQREAARAAVRAGSVIQAVLLVTAVVVALAVLGISIDMHAAVRSIVSAARTFAIPLIAIAAWMVLTPVAVYFAVTEK